MKKSKKQGTNYLKYTGMAIQLFVMLAILLFVGQWLDDYFDLSQKFLTAFLPVIGLVAYFFKLYYDLEG